MYRSPERSPQDSRDGIFCTVPRLHFLGCAFIWLGCFGEHILGLFRLSPSSLSKSVGFVSLSGKASLVSISATIVWIWTNYCKLSRNFVGAIRTKTINCRVSFIDLYLVFPRNSGIVFLPHTNTVILLEPYCGTITEPGLPVLRLFLSTIKTSYLVNFFLQLRLQCRHH